MLRAATGSCVRLFVACTAALNSASLFPAHFLPMDNTSTRIDEFTNPSFPGPAKFPGSFFDANPTQKPAIKKALPIERAMPGDMPSSTVIRLTKTDRLVIEELSAYCGESIVSVIGKSLNLYKTIVEAGDNGGKLIMRKSSLVNGTLRCLEFDARTRRVEDGDSLLRNRNPNLTPMANLGKSNESLDSCYETVVAVRDPFSTQGKCPIILNRAYITSAKGVKSERVTLRGSIEFMLGLASLESRTGLNKSVLIRDCLHLYNFVKREADKGDWSFSVGDVILNAV